MCDKEAIIHELKRRRKRITEQRRIMIDVITEEDCKSFKELYVKIAREGIRGSGRLPFIACCLTLEEIGAIERVQGYVRKDFGKEQISKEVSEET